MPIESDADRLAFLVDDGVAVPYTLAGGSTTDVVVLFDNPALIDRGESGDVMIRQAIASCREIDLPIGAANGDSVVINGTTYKVRNIVPDGMGFVSISLERS